MNRSIYRLVCLLALAGAAGMTGGCAYMKDRGRDTLDMFDVGITINKTWMPQFALYYDFFSAHNLGYAHENNWLLGVGNRQIGLLDYQIESYGLMFYGSMKDGAGPFDPKDPHQARDDQRELTERPTFKTGLFRVFTTDEPPPWPQYFQCHRACHLGWVGLILNLRPVDMLDFCLGWTTLDIMGDDFYSKAAAQAKAAEAAPAKDAPVAATPAAPAGTEAK